MGADFYIYETKSDNKAELTTISIVLYLSNSRADIVMNWFEQNHDAKRSYHNNVYFECFLGTILELYNHLNLVLDKTGSERDIYAMFYLPPQLKVKTWASGSDMFTESYYLDLKIIRDSLKEFIYTIDDEGSKVFDYEREFLYHFEI